MGPSCGRFDGDLSAFVDETLTPRRQEQVLYHLAGCAACRDEVHELRAVRAKLSRCKGSNAPGELAAKLESIAGEHACAPLYMASGKGQLPTGRRRRLAVQGGAALLVVVVSVVVLAALIAPELPRVSDPVGEAREQYARSTAAISVNEAVGAMLLARERGAEFGAPVSYSGLGEVDTLHAVPHDEVAALLGEAADSGLSLTGTQRVYIAAEDGGYLTTDVQVTKVAGEGTQLEVVDASGDTFSSTFLPNEIGLAEAPERWSFVVSELDWEIAGRPAVRVAALSDERMVASWWLDSELGLLLWSERYDATGEVSVAVGYTQLSFGISALAATGHIVALIPASASGTTGWCAGLSECPQGLAGLDLVAFTDVEREGANSMSLVYSDGVDTAVVSWSQGVLTDAATTRADAAAGLPSVVAWQCDDLVLTLATNASSDVMAEMLTQLPAAEPYRTSPTERVAAGLRRLVGVG